MNFLFISSLCFLVTTCMALSTTKSPHPSSTYSSSTRRSWIIKSIVSTSITLGVPFSPSLASDIGDTLPKDLRQYTALAPLGTPTSTGDKLLGLSLNEISTKLSHDLVDGANGKGGYFISGDISTQIFRDDCTFIDPTNSVSSLSRYQNALKILFDPKQSYVQLAEPLKIDESSREISAKIRSGGVLQLPWRPRISSYESIIKYKVDDNGLIQSQGQEWSKTAYEALKETFTPSILSSPYSNLPRPKNEPAEVTKLFDLVNGRRTDEYSQEERFEVASLIDQIDNAHYEWHKEDLNGKWALVYLQPGPDGDGIDRRIPFPDLPFNNNYQIFSTNDDSVINVGEILGPILEVRVGGSLQEDDASSSATPKRFTANINKGGLCIGEEGNKCIPLPIKGDGIFDGVYLGERLRIGQNINGGGARVVRKYWSRQTATTADSRN